MDNPKTPKIPTSKRSTPKTPAPKTPASKAPSPKTPSHSRVVLSQVMGFTESNLNGNVHGGVIMRLVDTAAGTAAVKHAGAPVVTAAMDEMSFLKPILLGDLVVVTASVNDVGSTSMEVGVKVDAENITTGEIKHASSAYLVFVAIDSSGIPRKVPPLKAETPEEVRRMRAAKIRRAARLRRKQEILSDAALDS